MLYALRFMVDTGMGGGSWVELPAGSWRRVPPEQVRKRRHAGRAPAAVNRTQKVACTQRGRSAAHASARLRRNRVAFAQAATYCQIEAHVKWDNVVVHPPDGVWCARWRGW